jgi:hypothetical protein
MERLYDVTQNVLKVLILFAMNCCWEVADERLVCAHAAFFATFYFQSRDRRT